MGFSHSREMRESRSCFLGEYRHPRLHTWHTCKSQDVTFSFSLSPRTQSAGSTLLPAKPQKSGILLPHPLMAEDEIPAFLENVKVWIPCASALRSRTPGTSLPPLGFYSPHVLLHLGAGASRALLPTQPCFSLPGLLPAALSGSFTASPVLDPDPWISAADPVLALAPASALGPAPFLFNPEVLLPEPKPCPWRSLKKVSLYQSERKSP